MNDPIAVRLLNIFGPCSVLHYGTTDTHILTSLLLMGCDAWAFGDGDSLHPRHLVRSGPVSEGLRFDTVLLELENGGTFISVLVELIARFGVPRNLAIRAPDQGRRAIENHLFANGWRRHPRGMATSDYAGLRDDVLGELSYYERVPDQALARWTVADLQKDRSLHMDMLRETGCRADAHIVRYALAAQLVRPGDTVLDCACGLGYGTAVLTSLSRGARYIGVDCDEATIEYANANYGREGVTYHTGDAAALALIPDASVDLVVSFETLEHVPDWEAALREFQRVLKPDGRLIASVPDRWMDETGQDPNPYHFHVFDWQKLAAGLSDNFILEARYIQTAPGGFKLQLAPRALMRAELDADVDSEWILVVASANPFAVDDADRANYNHPAFAKALAASGAAVVDFASGYDNPYLYRVLVQMGERLADDDKLARLAEWIALNARPGSADQGAAICVLGYRVLEANNHIVADDILKLIAEYKRASSEGAPNPHVTRWRLSLAFLAGRLAELQGDVDTAISWFRMAAREDWARFSPLLATKSIAACFFEGRLHLTRGDEGKARECFSAGLAHAIAALRGNLNDVVGDPDQPIPFGLQELAEVSDMGSQCVNAIAHLHLWKRAPGLFWQNVDVKRFGLASWNRNVELSNKNLQIQLRAEQTKVLELTNHLRKMASLAKQKDELLQRIAV